jgi:rSAM/selenodomain-associated transferase 2
MNSPYPDRRRVSVIVPTLDEAEGLARLLLALQRQPELREIVVVDGGSTDGTRDIAAALGARVLLSERGRGQQLRTGAAVASGEILLFLHADSVFPSGGLGAITALLDREPRVPGGNFRLLFDGDSRFARGLTMFYAGIRRFGLYYGDSGIFARRSAYDAVGGIRPIQLMEDYDFACRLERAGPTRRIEQPALVTSSRKFAGRRAIAIIYGWIWIHLAYWLGVPPDRLARFYYSSRPRRHRRRATGDLAGG